MLTLEVAREIFSYEKETGVLRWRIPAGRSIKAGAVAGSTNGQGYREVGFQGKTYQVSRVIWLIVTGQWPNGEIDHKNMNRSDNRLDNLRDATKSQNQANCRARSHNSSGFKGVGLPDKKSGRYYPYIQVNNKKIRLGGYGTAIEAHKAWVEAAKKYRGEFARGE